MNLTNPRVVPKTRRDKENDARERRQREDDLLAAQELAHFAATFNAGPDDIPPESSRSSPVPQRPLKPSEPRAKGAVKKMLAFEDDDEPPEAELPPRKKGRNMDRFLEELKRDQSIREATLKDDAGRFNTSITAIAAHKEKGVVSGSYDNGDLTTTNLYVTHLPLSANEDSFGHFFSRFGDIASVKIMWPRLGDPPRTFLTGFISFMRRDDAENALSSLDGQPFQGSLLRISWSKSVPVPLEPRFKKQGTALSDAPHTIELEGIHYADDLTVEEFSSGEEFDSDTAETAGKTQLTIKSLQKFIYLLQNLVSTRISIARAMAFAIDRAASAQHIVQILMESMMLKETPIQQKLARLHLLSDILHNSSVATVSGAWRYRALCETRLDALFDHFAHIFWSIPGRIPANGFKRHIESVLDLWDIQWMLFPSSLVESLKKKFEKPQSSLTQSEKDVQSLVESRTDLPSRSSASTARPTVNETKFKRISFSTSFKPISSQAIIPPGGAYIAPQREQRALEEEIHSKSSIEPAHSDRPSEQGVHLDGAGGEELDVDGEPIDIDGEALDIDGEALDMDGQPFDVDGEPLDMDGEPVHIGGDSIHGAEPVPNTEHDPSGTLADSIPRETSACADTAEGAGASQSDDASSTMDIETDSEG